MRIVMSQIDPYLKKLDISSPQYPTKNDPSGVPPLGSFLYLPSLIVDVSPWRIVFRLASLFGSHGLLVGCIGQTVGTFRETRTEKSCRKRAMFCCVLSQRTRCSLGVPNVVPQLAPLAEEALYDHKMGEPQLGRNWGLSGRPDSC